MDINLTKSWRQAIAVGLFTVVLFPLTCPAGLYSGSLTINGITATGNWNSTATSIRWDVDQLADSTWSYHYEFAVAADAKALSHIIFEVSDTFTDADFINTGSLTATLGSYIAGSDGNSNPSMPGTIYGIKFEDFPEDVEDTSEGTWAIDFTSDRAPV